MTAQSKDIRSSRQCLEDALSILDALGQEQAGNRIERVLGFRVPGADRRKQPQELDTLRCGGKLS